MIDEMEEVEERDEDLDEVDGILGGQSGKHHALKKDESHVENVKTLIHHIVMENRYGDLVSDDEIGLDPVALARQIQDGGSW
jgi:hypothetical protein